MDGFEKSSDRQQSVNQKILVCLHLVRIGLFHMDLTLVKNSIEKARKLIDEGGDWDRRNRLKVYEGCYFMMTRDFKGAAKLFQVSLRHTLCM